MAQAVPQAPQCAALVAVSTQAPLQRVCPAGHTHMPIEHVVPPVQALPQAPQLVASEPVSTHALPQAVRPIEHEVWQRPAEHT